MTNNLPATVDIWGATHMPAHVRLRWRLRRLAFRRRSGVIGAKILSSRRQIARKYPSFRQDWRVIPQLSISLSMRLSSVAHASARAPGLGLHPVSSADRAPGFAGGRSVFVKEAQALNARPAEAVPWKPEEQAFQLERLRLQDDIPGGFKIPGSQSVPFRPGFFVPKDQRL